MTPEKIEALMTENELPWKRIIAKMWAIQDLEGKYPQLVVLIEKSEKNGADLLKFVVFICDVPVDADVNFFKEFLRYSGVVMRKSKCPIIQTKFLSNLLYAHHCLLELLSD